MSSYSRNIIFIGGIHGVGKSYLCQELCRELGYEHLIASELIAQRDTQQAHKQVSNIESNQEILIRKLQNIINPNKHYLLDGHFSLFDAEGNIQLIPLSTFKAINPSALIVLTDDPALIKSRLELRDNLDYEVNILKAMQNKETQHATNVAKKMGLKVHVFDVEKMEELRCILSTTQ